LVATREAVVLIRGLIVVLSCKDELTVRLFSLRLFIHLLTVLLSFHLFLLQLPLSFLFLHLSLLHFEFFLQSSLLLGFNFLDFNPFINFDHNFGLSCLPFNAPLYLNNPYPQVMDELIDNLSESTSDDIFPNVSLDELISFKHLLVELTGLEASEEFLDLFDLFLDGHTHG
jgi:hypothetical protein